MPCRYPLLGTEDHQLIKAKRPFTVQSDQQIWDLGNPTQKRITKPMIDSKFAMGMRSFKYPFVPDHSAPTGISRLAWMNEIQNLDYSLLLPDLIEGLMDKGKTYHVMAMTAITDVLKHGPVEKMIDALPTLIIACKRAIAMNNIGITRRIIEVIRRMCVIQPGVGPDLAFYVQEILIPLNYYYENAKNQNDQIVYNEALYSDIYDVTENLMRLFVSTAGPELETCQRNIKLAMPTYQIIPDI